MPKLSLSTRIYILLLATASVFVLAVSVALFQHDPSQWIVILVFAVGIATFDLIPIKFYGSSMEATISSAVKFACVLLFPPTAVALTIFFGTVMGEFPVKRAWVKKVFNVSQMTLSWTVTALVYWILHDPTANFLGSLQNILVISLAGLTDFGVNSLLVSLVVSFANHLPLRYVWSQNFPKAILHELSMVPLGAFLAILWQFNPVSLPLAALPLLVVRHAYLVADQLQRQTREALVAMMRVIDERDQHTADHSDRVSYYARTTAEALDLDQEEIEVIAQSALLHDLGKVGMADDILFGPKILNSHERKRAEKHAEVGAELLSKFPLFERGANLVRHHHERYDGTGYPDQIQGEDIPIGARIISVADAYQAMTEDRPYRRGMSQPVAVQRLITASGTQFDPRVVQAFVRALPPAQAQSESVSPVLVPVQA